MSIAVYVIDTSYLVELFHCEGFCDETASRMVHKRFEAATRKGGRFYVPLPCLFELGDHIADVKREDSRRKLANKLLETVRISLLENDPWTITPTGSPEEILPSLLARFAPLAAKQGIGLVDAFTLHEALRLKEKLKKHKARIHIWTNDRALKRHEPDAEPFPYLW
jgi:predicted nucleic acid-binding protein